MKNLSICSLFVLVLAFSGILYAQEGYSHFFVVTTFEHLYPEGGSQAEFDSLAHFFTENATKKNEFVLVKK